MAPCATHSLHHGFQYNPDNHPCGYPDSYPAASVNTTYGRTALI